MGKAKRNTPSAYNLNLPENWCIVQLKEKLTQVGIKFLTNCRKSKLIAMWKNKVTQNEAPRTSTEIITHNASDTNTRPCASGVNNDGDLLTAINKLSNKLTSIEGSMSVLSDKVDNLDEVQKRSGIALNPNATPASASRLQRDALHSHSISTSTSACPRPVSFNLDTTTSSFTSSQDRMTQMPPGLRSTQEIGSVTAAYQPPLATMMEKTTMSQFGYAPDSLPFVETVSPHLRKNILEGKDVNLASLLIPQYSGPSPMYTSTGEKYDKPDPRLNRNLSITEFMQAFGTYKNIMCEGYPNRRVELDLYERDIIEMATRYKDSRFYQYHKQFSAKAAAHLTYNNIKVDWSARDSKLYCNIFASHQAITCALCSSVSHSTGFCPKSLDNTLRLSTRFSYEKGGDNLNRTKTLHQGQEICNHFNKERGCFRINCKYAHLCPTCKKEHSQSRCPLAKNGKTGQIPQSGPKK